MLGTVDEESQPLTISWPTLKDRKRPVVLRGAACHWGARNIVQKHLVDDLKTTWRIHPLSGRTVWEAECHFLEASVGEFLEWEESKSLDGVNPANPFAPFDRGAHWAYADYKHVKELAGDWLKRLEHLVDWSALGCDKSAEDSTVWLGTGGSHTPLHHDTYGMNLVSQLHGRKRWVLFPPGDHAHLYATRVPYEESSVYSQVDVRAPDLSRFPRFTEASAISVTLEPGDVLFIPKHWWHFVEAVDTSLSINVWIDAPDDAQDRAKEALVRVLVTSLSESITSEVGPSWLNPTEEALWPLEETLQVADLAFGALEACDKAAANDQGDADGPGAPPSTRSKISVKALVDAITAPDVLNHVVNRLRSVRGITTVSGAGGLQTSP